MTGSFYGVMQSEMLFCLLDLLVVLIALIKLLVVSFMSSEVTSQEADFWTVPFLCLLISLDTFSESRKSSFFCLIGLCGLLSD